MNRRIRHHVNPLNFRHEPDPIDWSEAFARPQQPLEVEIGPGKARFLLERARRCPEINIVGLEIREPMVERLNKLIAEAGLDNARGVTCNANISLVRLFAEDSVERAYVHFPDPWFKKRHHKRRVIKTPLLDDLARILIEGGEFHFATDFEAYAEEALELIGRHPAYGEPTRCEAPFGILSDREAWHRSQDDPIYRYLFRVHGSRLPREESAGATARAGDDRPADAVDAEPPR